MLLGVATPAELDGDTESTAAVAGPGRPHGPLRPRPGRLRRPAGAGPRPLGSSSRPSPRCATTSSPRSTRAGGVLSGDELALTLLASVARRRRVPTVSCRARAVVRAALETEAGRVDEPVHVAAPGRRRRPSWSLSRSDGLDGEELADYAASLGIVADQLAATDPLPTPAGGARTAPTGGRPGRACRRCPTIASPVSPRRRRPRPPCRAGSSCTPGSRPGSRGAPRPRRAARRRHPDARTTSAPACAPASRTPRALPRPPGTRRAARRDASVSSGSPAGPGPTGAPLAAGLPRSTATDRWRRPRRSAGSGTRYRTGTGVDGADDARQLAEATDDRLAPPRHARRLPRAHRARPASRSGPSTQLVELGATPIDLDAAIVDALAQPRRGQGHQVGYRPSSPPTPTGPTASAGRGCSPSSATPLAPLRAELLHGPTTCCSPTPGCLARYDLLGLLDELREPHTRQPEPGQTLRTLWVLVPADDPSRAARPSPARPSRSPPAPSASRCPSRGCRTCTAPAPDAEPPRDRRRRLLADTQGPRAHASSTTCAARRATRDAWSSTTSTGERDAAGRTALPQPQWAEGLYAQVAVAWVLGCVFVRFCEDNGLVADAAPGRAGQPPRPSPSSTARPTCRPTRPTTTGTGCARCSPATAQLPGDRRRVRRPQPDLAARARRPTAPARCVQAFQAHRPRHRRASATTSPTRPGTPASSATSTKTSPSTPRRSTRCCRPRCSSRSSSSTAPSNPPSPRSASRDTDLIDPTCGSGHFLLGAFHRLFDRWVDAEPGTNRRELARRALDAVAGVDLNPFAAAIARFRLLVAALRAGGDTRLADAPDYPIHIAVGDSPPARRPAQLALDGIGARRRRRRRRRPRLRHRGRRGGTRLCCPVGGRPWSATRRTSR